MTLMRLLLFVGWTSLFFMAQSEASIKSTGQLENKKKGQTPSKPFLNEVTKVWTKVGARVGWISAKSFRLGGDEGSKDEIPAFSCNKTTWQAIVSNRLPEPEQVFGLHLQYAVESELKHLGRFKRLRSLDLSSGPHSLDRK